MFKPVALTFVVMFTVALLTVSELAAQRPGAPTTPRAASATVDMSVVMKESTRLKANLDRLKKDYEAKAEGLKKEGERGNQLTEEARKLPANSPERKKLEQQLLQLRADYELHGKRVTEDTRDAEATLVLGLITEVKAELARYGQANGVQFVLRQDPSPPDLSDPRAILQEIHKPIVYQRGNDVTQQIVDSLNKRGPAGGPAASTARPTNPTRPAPR